MARSSARPSGRPCAVSDFATFRSVSLTPSPLVSEPFSGDVLINPDRDYGIRKGEEIIVLAEDDDSYEAANTNLSVNTAHRDEAEGLFVSC